MASSVTYPHARIRFVNDEKFEELVTRNPEHNEPRNNITAPFYPESISIKTADKAEHCEDSYSRGAVNCSTGFLIVNGLDLHSHMTFHQKPFNPNRSSYITPRAYTNMVHEYTYFKNAFNAKLNVFFGQLDKLIKSGKLSNEEITLDFIITGGHEDCNWSRAAGGEIQKLVDERLDQTVALADANNVKVNLAASAIWGQPRYQAPDSDYSSRPMTSVHYDPKENIVSLHQSNSTVIEEDKDSASKVLQVYKITDLQHELCS